MICQSLYSIFLHTYPIYVIPSLFNANLFIQLTSKYPMMNLCYLFCNAPLEYLYSVINIRMHTYTYNMLVNANYLVPETVV